MSFCHIMVDVETLSQRTNAAIVSIGACKFSFSKGIFDEFYINVDAADCKRLGLDVDKSTIEWWQKQPKEAREAWMKDPQPLAVAMKALSDWAGDKNHKWWANGAPFDFPILESAWRAVDMQPHWKYWNQNDYRTICNVAGVNNKVLRENSKDTYHNALADAKAQTEILIDLLGEVINDKSFSR